MYLNLDDFEKKYKVKNEPYIEVYKIANKETQIQNIAQIFKNDISSYSKEKLTEYSNHFNVINKLNHPSILKYTGYSPIDFNKNNQPVFTMELSTYNRFFDKLNSIGTEYRKLIIIYGIASAMSYLHSHNIIHCDLSLNNILLDNNLYPKLTGFNFSKVISKESSKKNRFSKYNGSSAYFAPEIFTRKEYSKSSDVYAFGILFFNVLNSKQKQSDIFFSDFFEKVGFLKEKPNVDDERYNIPVFYRGLLKKCWSDNPEERPTFDNIVKILKTNPNLIEEEEYQRYIKYIDDSIISFDSTKEFHEFDDVIKSEKIEKYHSRKKIFDASSESALKLLISNYSNFVAVYNKLTYEKYTVNSSMHEISKFSVNDFTNFIHELSVISQLNHPAIEKFVGYCQFKLENEPNPIFFTEYLSFGNLPYIMKKGTEFQLWDDTQRLICIYGIASAMSYLHSHNIIHRDLKPENIYFDEFFFPKISGFILSKELLETNESQIQGTPAYLSPEVYTNKKYGKASDVYSFSLIVYQIMTNCTLFNDLSNVNQVYEIVVSIPRSKRKANIRRNCKYSTNRHRIYH